MRIQLLVFAVVTFLSCGSEPGPAPAGGGGGATASGGGPGASGGGQGVLGGGSGASGGGGGGATAVTQQELVAGSRLKVRTMVGTDGSRQQLGFFDSQLNEPCFFYAASDGTQRCFVAATLNVPNWYEDSACTKPLAYLAQATSGCTQAAPSRFALQLVTDCGSPHYVAWSAGAVFSGSMMFSKSATSCAAQPVPAGYTLYRTTAVAPPSTFVQGNVLVEP